MGSQIILDQGQQHPFRIALNRLRAVINNEHIFPDLVRRGVTEFVPIVGIATGNDYKRVFGTWYPLWVRGSIKHQLSRKDTYLYSEEGPGNRIDRVRECLIALRAALNDSQKYEDLVRIGPCAFTLCWDDDVAFEKNEGPILVTNYIPNALPNADYSLRLDGTMYFHS